MCLIFSIGNAYFLKKQIAVPIIIFCEWMPHWMPLKNPTRFVSEGCPLSTEWEVIERGFGGCARARGRIWRVSPGRVPPSKATLRSSHSLHMWAGELVQRPWLGKRIIIIWSDVIFHNEILSFNISVIYY